MPLLLAALLAALLLPLHAGAAAGSACHQEPVPAATLLLPYFELDTHNPNGLTTLFSINNASAAAVLAHVAIWSDLAVPILNFNVYLTGYDVQTINLRDVIVYGDLPQTASMGQDPSDVISPKGSLGQDINYASCQGQLPPLALPASLLSSVQRALTGLSSPMLEDLCAGQALGDLIARGYVTVDTVSNCTVRFPGDAGYFGAANADATDQNVLWGSWYIINAAQEYAQGSDMVAVVADATSPETTTPGRYTFYGRYVGWSAADHRAPLATTFAAPFASGGPFDAGTDLLIWRDTKFAQGPFSCPATPQRPAWYPLVQEALVVFDEQEHPQVPSFFPVGAQPQPFVTPFEQPPIQPLIIAPAAAQRTRVGGAEFPVPFTFGWVYLDFNRSNVPTVGPNPPIDPAAAQAWVIATQSSKSHFAVALDAYRLDSACNANHFVP